MKTIGELKQEKLDVMKILAEINNTKRRLRIDVLLNADRPEIKAYISSQLSMAIHSGARAEQALAEINNQISQENIRLDLERKENAALKSKTK